MLTTTLIQSVGGLNAAIVKRNELIERYKSMPQGSMVPLYFGLPQHDGHINQEYRDLISAISTQTDDGIFLLSNCAAN